MSQEYYSDTEYYDLINGAIASQSHLFVQQAKSFSGSYLDLACGTGRLTWPISQLNFCTSYGLDLSPAMLARAQAKVAKWGRRPHFIEADMRDFSLQKSFNFITCGFNSIQHLTSSADLTLFFQSVSQHLASEGRFLFDCLNPLVLPLATSPFIRRAGHRFFDPQFPDWIEVDIVSHYRSETQIADFEWIYRKQETSLFRRTFSMRILSYDEIYQQIQKSGLAIEKEWGDNSGAKLNRQSPSMIFLCRKL